MNDGNLSFDMSIIDVKRIFELLEEHCLNAIWSVECKLDHITRAVGKIGELDCFPNRDNHKI